jgi:hypothetical protein
VVVRQLQGGPHGIDDPLDRPVGAVLERRVRLVGVDHAGEASGRRPLEGELVPQRRPQRQHPPGVVAVDLVGGAVGQRHPAGEAAHVRNRAGDRAHTAGRCHDVAVGVVVEPDRDPVCVGERPHQAVGHLEAHLPPVRPREAGREQVVAVVVEGESRTALDLVGQHPAVLVVIPALPDPVGSRP